MLENRAFLDTYDINLRNLDAKESNHMGPCFIGCQGRDPCALTNCHAACVPRIREFLDNRVFSTIEELQNKLGISRLTVYNDIDVLQDTGFTVYSEMF
jgi:hypothetical protein